MVFKENTVKGTRPPVTRYFFLKKLR